MNVVRTVCNTVVAMLRKPAHRRHQQVYSAEANNNRRDVAPNCGNHNVGGKRQQAMAAARKVLWPGQRDEVRLVRADLGRLVYNMPPLD